MRRRAYTLVELLVTAGMVGLLIGILWPVVSAARRTAWQVHCAANLRQVGVALAAYAARERSLPYAAVVGGRPNQLLEQAEGPGFLCVTWDDLLDRDLGGDLTEAELNANLAPRTRPTLTCSADRTPRVFTVPFHVLSYAIVEGPVPLNPPPSGPYFEGTAGQCWKADFRSNAPLPIQINVRPTDIRRPSETFAVVEYPNRDLAQGLSGSRTSELWSHWSTLGPDHKPLRIPIPPPHRGRYNALYHDGHVDAVFERDTLGSGTDANPLGPWTRDPND